ncbi:MAG: FHA domain-containing protein, partial [Phycisphaerae bacterium]|nr:FHA domain-containing protein [Phycisphaerae bacterium]
MRSGAADTPFFRVSCTEDPRANFDLAASEPSAVQTIGRDGQATLRLKDIRVSRKHASLERTPEGWMVQDLGSRSGTYVDGRRLGNDERVLLQFGNVLSVGPFELRLMDGTPSESAIPVRDDAAVSIVQSIAPEELGSLASRRLEVLLELAGQLNAAQEIEHALDRVAEALLAGTGYARALIVRDGVAGCERLASRATSKRAWSSPVSRTLLAAARSARGAVRLEDR